MDKDFTILNTYKIKGLNGLTSAKIHKVAVYGIQGNEYTAFAVEANGDFVFGESNEEFRMIGRAMDYLFKTFG